MSGKIVGSAIVAIALVAGIAIYYLQVFYYYERVTLAPEAVTLTLAEGGSAAIPAEDIEAIDANSSPIRFRACFSTSATAATLEQAFQPYPLAEPLNAPFWFDCFDAAAIGQALEDGTARAFLGQGNIAHGVDRVIAVTEDGRGYIWHQVNEEIKK